MDRKTVEQIARNTLMTSREQMYHLGEQWKEAMLRQNLMNEIQSYLGSKAVVGHSDDADYSILIETPYRHQGKTNSIDLALFHMEDVGNSNPFDNQILAVECKVGIDREKLQLDVTKSKRYVNPKSGSINFDFSMLLICSRKPLTYVPKTSSEIPVLVAFANQGMSKPVLYWLGSPENQMIHERIYQPPKDSSYHPC